LEASSSSEFSDSPSSSTCSLRSKSSSPCSTLTSQDYTSDVGNEGPSLSSILRELLPERYAVSPPSSIQASLSLDSSSTSSVPRHAFFLSDGVPMGKPPRKQRVPNSLRSATRNLKRTRNVTREACEAAILFRCKCGRDCGAKFSCDDLVTFRKQIWENATMAQVTQSVADALERDGVARSPTDDDFGFKFMVSGTQVCGPFYQRAIGVCKRKYLDIRKRVIMKKRRVMPRNGGPRTKGNLSSRNVEMLEWCRSFFKLHGQYIPNKEEMHLPIEMTKQWVWEKRYKLAVENPLKLTQFYHLWREHFPKVCIE